VAQDATVNQRASKIAIYDQICLNDGASMLVKAKTFYTFREIKTLCSCFTRMGDCTNLVRNLLSSGEFFDVHQMYEAFH
jgi:hypothetical protein